MDQRDQLPLHPVPHTGREAATAGGISITGLVAHPRTLAASDLAPLPRTTLAEPFTCEEGWTVPGIEWRGVRLADVLALSQPTPPARFVRVSAGTYTIVLAMDELGESLLCDTLNGETLSAAHGAPWRLVVPGGKCFTSVKWVEELELTAEPGDNSGERIARARLG